MYYVQEVSVSEAALTIRLTFLLDPDLTLRFPHQGALATWQRGLDQALVALLTPDGQRGEEPDAALGVRVRRSGSSADGAGGAAALRRRRSSDDGDRAAPATPPPPASAAQLQKRQRMAALLAAAAGPAQRAGARWSPAAWLQRPRPPPSAAQAAEELDLALDEQERQKPRLVSVGTQTEDAEALDGSAGVAAAPAAPGGGGADADMAASYAAMLASVWEGAAAAGSPAPAAASPPPPPESGGAGTPPRAAGSPSPFGGPAAVQLPAAWHTPPPPPAGAADLAAALLPPPPGSPAPAPLAVNVEVIDPGELRLGRLLGAGAQGAVHAAWFRETPVAVKRFSGVEGGLHEVGMHLGVGSHDNVVALRALCHEASGALLMVLEYCARWVVGCRV
jgi:hypothetical protein